MKAENRQKQKLRNRLDRLAAFLEDYIIAFVNLRDTAILTSLLI